MAVKSKKIKRDLEALEAENAALKNQLIHEQAHREASDELLKKAQSQIAWFEEQLKLGKYRQFGRHSEKSSALPLFDEFDTDELVEEDSVEEVNNTDTNEQDKSSKKKTRKRKVNTSNLPRERVLHDLSDEEKLCSCGCNRRKIGEDIVEKIDYQPATLKVIEHVTPKYACKNCETITAAKKPAGPIPKCMATTNLIVDVIVKKFDHHLPFYRQSKIFEQLGADIPDATIGNWALGAAEALAPLGEAFWQALLESNYIQADETPVKVLNPDKKGYVWLYHSLDPGNRCVLYEFDLSRGKHVPKNRLQYYKGILQTDGYASYFEIGKQEDIDHLGCWDHARRKFVDAIKVLGGNQSGIAGKLFKLINKLYKIERELKNASDDYRAKKRQDLANKTLDKIFALAASAKTLPKSSLGSAITYLVNNEPYLRRYTENGHTQISNCLAENLVRPLAVGRRNWLFVGNETSANKAMLFYSIIHTCKLNNIDVRKYLTYVLGKTHDMRNGSLSPCSLLPQFINPELVS